MQQINKGKFILLILFIPIFFNGCYDRFELDNLAYVVALGADLGSGDNLDITYQIAIPAKMIGESNETGKQSYTTYTVSAPSLDVANTLVNKKVSKGINLSHIKLIIYSEEIARADLSGHVNVLISQTDIRPRVAVAVCQGSAKDFLNSISPKLEISPSRYYDLLFSTYSYATFSEPSQLVDLYTSFQSLDRNSYTTYIKLSENSGDEKQIELAGLAIFDETKLIATNEDEDFVLAHLILTNNLNKTGYVVPDFNKNNRFISVKLSQNTKPKIKVTLNGNNPHIKCTIDLDAHLVASGSEINFYEKENAIRLKNELDKSLKDTINNFLSKSIHEYKVDIASIGRYAKINFKTWKDFENYNWLLKYKNSTYELSVNTKLYVSQIVSHKVPNTRE